MVKAPPPQRLSNQLRWQVETLIISALALIALDERRPPGRSDLAGSVQTRRGGEQARRRVPEGLAAAIEQTEPAPSRAPRPLGLARARLQIEIELDEFYSKLPR